MTGLTKSNGLRRESAEFLRRMNRKKAAKPWSSTSHAFANDAVCVCGVYPQVFVLVTTCIHNIAFLFEVPSAD